MARFEWDEKKNRINRKKHGIWFEDAAQVFIDPHARFFLDQNHSSHEDRYVVIGHSSENRLLVVIHCYRKLGNVVRIISARPVTKKERLFYEEGI